MTNWNDTPPTVAGTYWVKGRTSGEEWPMRLHEDGAFEGHPSEVQFGPRIPTADELAELPGLIDKYADLVRTQEAGLLSAMVVGDAGFAGWSDQIEAAHRAKINAILGVVE